MCTCMVIVYVCMYVCVCILGEEVEAACVLLLLLFFFFFFFFFFSNFVCIFLLPWLDELTALLTYLYLVGNVNMLLFLTVIENLYIYFFYSFPLC